MAGRDERQHIVSVSAFSPFLSLDLQLQRGAVPVPGGSAAAAGLPGRSARRLRQCQRRAAPPTTGEPAAPQGDGRAAEVHPAGPEEGQTTGTWRSNTVESV